MSRRREPSPETADAPEPPKPARYRIEDVARLASTTVRNVRSYREKGLLPPPAREGRLAFYSEAHVARLRTLGTLLERGYSLHNIAELFAGWEAGKDLRDVLGLEEAMTSPFSDEEPAYVDVLELATLYGAPDPAVLARAIESGLVVPQDDGRLLVPSMRLLRAGADLHRAGIPVDELFDELGRLRRDVDGMTSRFVRLVADRLLTPRLAEDTSRVHELATLVRSVRPLAKRVVDAELSRALDTHVRAVLGDGMSRLFGPSATRPTRKKTAKGPS